MPENKIKHLEFIQTIVNRISGNSFLLKGWSVTLVIGLFALLADKHKGEYLFIAYLAFIIFWLLDAYFLCQERLYRALYNSVRIKNDDAVDFSMNTKNFYKGKKTFFRSMFSFTLLIFYLPMLAIMLIMIFLI